MEATTDMAPSPTRRRRWGVPHDSAPDSTSAPGDTSLTLADDRCQAPRNSVWGTRDAGWAASAHRPRDPESGGAGAGRWDDLARVLCDLVRAAAADRRRPPVRTSWTLDVRQRGISKEPRR